MKYDFGKYFERAQTQNIIIKSYQSPRSHRTLCCHTLNLGLGPYFEFFEQCPEWHIQTASVITLTGTERPPPRTAVITDAITGYSELWCCTEKTRLIQATSCRRINFAEPCLCIKNPSKILFIAYLEESNNFLQNTVFMLPWPSTTPHWKPVTKVINIYLLMYFATDIINIFMWIYSTKFVNII